jgi:hypothetical protein
MPIFTDPQHLPCGGLGDGKRRYAAMITGDSARDSLTPWTPALGTYQSADLVLPEQRRR